MWTLAPCEEAAMQKCYSICPKTVSNVPAMACEELCPAEASWTKWSCPQYSLTGHHGVVRLLLEAGAEVGLVTRDTGYSSLHLAASGVASLAL